MANAGTATPPATGFRWTPSWVAWALGSFGFLIATIFIGRIYYVHWYRSDAAVLREDLTRASENFQDDIHKLMTDADDWRRNMPLDAGFRRWAYAPPVEGVLAFRVFARGELRAEWRMADFKEESSGLSIIYARETETRFARLGAQQLILAWTSKDGVRSLLIFDGEKLNSKFVKDPYRAEETSVALLNSMDQVIFERGKPLEYEKIRGKIQYNYEPASELQTLERASDILAFMSIPNIKGLVLIGRIDRKL